MFVIRLPNGNLLVPESALADDGAVLGDVYVEIGPADAAYARLAEHAITEQDLAKRRRQWQEGDAALQRQFAEYLASLGSAEPGGQG
jgi:gamma-glutamyltranspeptidase